MFGYFRPKDSYLRSDENRLFHAYYCRLCYCLWALGGQKSRFFTTYDVAVFNLVIAIAGLDKRPEYVPCQRFKHHNRDKYKDDHVGNLLAELSVIAFAIKIQDDIDDEGTFKAKLAAKVFSKPTKKVKAKHGELFSKGVECTKEIDRLQKNGAETNVVLDVYGQMMKTTFHYFFPTMEEKYLNLCYYLARWAFFVDMIADYDDDVKEGQRNSLMKPDSKTLEELFNKHYAEFSLFAKKENEDLKQAINEVKNDSLEWVVLNKIVSHALSTVIPNALEGKDVKFRYIAYLKEAFAHEMLARRIERKYEKSSNNSQSN